MGLRAWMVGGLNPHCSVTRCPVSLSRACFILCERGGGCTVTFPAGGGRVLCVHVEKAPGALGGACVQSAGEGFAHQAPSPLPVSPLPALPCCCGKQPPWSWARGPFCSRPGSRGDSGGSEGPGALCSAGASSQPLPTAPSICDPPLAAPTSTQCRSDAVRSPAPQVLRELPGCSLGLLSPRVAVPGMEGEVLRQRVLRSAPSALRALLGRPRGACWGCGAACRTFCWLCPHSSHWGPRLSSPVCVVQLVVMTGPGGPSPKFLGASQREGRGSGYHLSRLPVSESESISCSVVSSSLQPHGLPIEFHEQEFRSG